VDISFQEDNMYRRNRRLVCLIWTLPDSNGSDWWIGWLAGWGTGEAITESAMNGEMILKKFKQHGFARRFEWRGAANSCWKSTYNKRAHRLMKALKYYGFKAILSGGFTFFGII
jgi:phosphoserine phosphatase